MDIKNLFNDTIDTVIGIDTDREVIQIYSKKADNKNVISYVMHGYKAKPFSSDFYSKLGAIIAQYRQDHPDHKLTKATVVLPDSAVLTDTVNIPIINKKAMDTSLAASLSNLYGNSSDLKFNRMLATQTKQLATYAVSAMRKDILANIQRALSEQQLNVSDITYSSASATNAAITLNPKLKNGTFLLLDVEEESAKIIFVVKGKTVGFYSLPFGHKALYKTRVMPEDLLFDHPYADLIVLNAKEKAKAKALTMADADEEATLTESATVVVEEDDDWAETLPSGPNAQDEDDAAFEAELLAAEESESELITRGRKKAPRKLPKFMLRPTPTNREDFMYENFRVFVKWTLELIASNQNIINLGIPEAVYVNMPDEYYFLYEKVNLEVEDNGIRFMPLLVGDKKDIVRKHLDLYGGFYTKQLNQLNNFHAVQLDNVKSRTNDKAPEKKGGAPDQKKDGFKKVVEKIKKIASYDLTGGGN